jgi:hypothetical protein
MDSTTVGFGLNWSLKVRVVAEKGSGSQCERQVEESHAPIPPLIRPAFLPLAISRAREDNSVQLS